MMTTERLLSGEELLLMGAIGPCELVAGRIVSLPISGAEHGAILAEIATDLGLFVRRDGLGRMAGGPVGIYTGRNPDTVRLADLVFISRKRIDRLPKGFLEVAPELVVEVVSPTNTWIEMREKITEYFAIGVVWVWVIEPELRSVLVYSSPAEAEIVKEHDTLRGSGILDGFSISVASLFQVG